jgi:hypothetical protein
MKPTFVQCCERFSSQRIDPLWLIEINRASHIINHYYYHPHDYGLVEGLPPPRPGRLGRCDFISSPFCVRIQPLRRPARSLLARPSETTSVASCDSLFDQATAKAFPIYNTGEALTNVMKGCRLKQIVFSCPERYVSAPKGTVSAAWGIRNAAVARESQSP